MKICHDILKVQTTTDLDIHNLTSEVQRCVDNAEIREGQALIFSRHTTTALAINEYEHRLLADIKSYLRKLAPVGDRYLHNDLHLRDVPDDEPENAHSHLMALTLHTHEIIPIHQGKLALGTYQSLLFLELDGPRQRTVAVQIMGI